MKKRGRKINWRVLIISILAVYLIAFVGSLFTSAGVSSEWYGSIKPAITPPGWVFPVVWNILYLFIALSFYSSWISAKNKHGRRNLVVLFGVNLILNALWSYLFFSLQNPLLAFIDLTLIWLSIIFMMILTKNINIKSFYLLMPYFVWVSFAGFLNWMIAF